MLTTKLFVLSINCKYSAEKEKNYPKNKKKALEIPKPSLSKKNRIAAYSTSL